MKELRFAELVKTAGHPKTESLWSDPRQNKSFMQAVRANRVLTVIQQHHGKDFGQIGFHEQPLATYLLFPKPLPRSDARVIGIKYDAIEEPAVKDPAQVAEPARKPTRQSKPAKTAPPPVEKQFDVTIQRTALIKTNVRVTAKTQTAARARALQLVKDQPLDLTQAEVEDKVLTADERR